MNANNSIKEPSWEDLVRYQSGETGKAESAEIEKWAVQSTQNRDQLNQIGQLLAKTDEYYSLKQFNQDEAWHHIKNNIRPNKLRTLYSRFRKYAAIVAVVAFTGIAGIYFYYTLTPDQKFDQIIAGPREVIEHYELPDGTAVTMNENSTLRFPMKFNKKFREVILTGEAFFDVHRDSLRPFIITAGDARIRVLGTSFSINAYPENDRIEVVVETGTVQVVCTEKEMILGRGERGLVIQSQNQLEKKENSDPNYLSWKTRSFLFNQTPLVEVVQQLEKVYHTNISINERELENLKLTATFENKTEEFILDVICLTFDLELLNHGGTYILSKTSVTQY